MKSFERLLTLALDVDDLGNQEVALSRIGSVYYRKTTTSERRVLATGSGISKRSSRGNSKLRAIRKTTLAIWADVYFASWEFCCRETSYSEAVALLARSQRLKLISPAWLKASVICLFAEADLSQALATYEQALALGEKRKDRGNLIGALARIVGLAPADGKPSASDGLCSAC